MQTYPHDDLSQKPFKCACCGLTASSKNPAIRSVFSDQSIYQQTVRMVSLVEQQGKDLAIRVSMFERTMRETLENYLRVIRHVPESELPQLICGLIDGHDWQPDGWQWQD